MPRVQIHCYGCSATVSVATARSTEDLRRAGWSLLKGETYCPACAPAQVPAGAVSVGADEELAALPEQDDTEPEGASVVARIKWPRFGRSASIERRRPLLRPAAAVVATTLQPLRNSNAPVTSHSKVSSRTIALFCIAAVLTLATLGSNELLLRLPGVVIAFAAGLSWLRDLRSDS